MTREEAIVVLHKLKSTIPNADGKRIIHIFKTIALDLVIKALEQEQKTGRWIPCSERLPEERDWCLAVFEEVDTGFIGIPYIAEYLMGNHTIATTEDGWIIHNCTDIENEYAEYYKKLRCVAWQPLPEPYKAESEVEKNDSG